MVSQSSGIAEIMRRLAKIETRINRMNQVGKVSHADYQNLTFTVQLLEDDDNTGGGFKKPPITGVRCLYTRMHPHLTEFALPEVGETVRLEETLGGRYVITGSYGHNIEQPDHVTVPLYAYGGGRDREAVPREIHVVDGAIQLRSRSNNDPGVAADENAFVYVGQIGITFGDNDEESYAVVLSYLGSGSIPPIDGIERAGTELIVGPLGVAVRATTLWEGGTWTRASFNSDSLALVTTDKGTAGVTLEPIESDESVHFTTDLGGTTPTNSGGNPSHSHSIPPHLHAVPPHVHPLPIRKTTRLRVNDSLTAP